MSEHPMAPASGTEHRSSRTLSKSDFKLARTCDAKLFFREHQFPDNRAGNPYLALLAEGAYMVEALAKAKYPNGIRPEYNPDPRAACVRTIEYLQQNDVVLFEATLMVGRRQARADILDKKGHVIRLLEVKSKSFDGAKHAASLAGGKAGALCGVKAPFPVLKDWVEKVEDVTFQVLLLEKLLPGVVVQPYLILVDTSKAARIDNIPALFAIERRTAADGTTRIDTATYTGSPGQLAELDLITEVDVSAQVSQLRNVVEAEATKFESLLDAPLPSYAAQGQRGAKCAKCEFRGAPAAGASGFAECWGPLANPTPHMLELFSIGTARAPDQTALATWMVGQGKASLLDIPEEGLVNADGKVGPVPRRQRRQIEFARSNEVFVGDQLRAKIESLRAPLHFIDFETSRLALPYHLGMRPYGLVTFQWSCHSVDKPGTAPRHAEWLNSSDLWPNQLFAEALRETLGDEGTVLTWSHFEETTLRQIVEDLDHFGRRDPELAGWIRDVFDRRRVDLHEWARNDYYHPGMRGRTSIKVVLDALWKSDEAMRQQFERWTGSHVDASQDPYASLPPIEINGIVQEVHEGTGAMRAYQEMMYGVNKQDIGARGSWASLLKQYCALDTLSMVLILEHWRRATA
jgi:Domain of unknown function(DUF2779)